MKEEYYLKLKKAEGRLSYLQSELDAMPSSTLKEVDEKINKAYYLKGYIEALETLTLENHE